MKYYIGPISFNSKKQCESFTRNIINDIGTTPRIKEGDNYFTFFNDLIKNHPDYEEKVGCGIDYFFIQPNAMNRKTYQTMIKRLDGTTIDFSWVYCCQFRVKSSMNNLTTAMRQAIAPDTIRFKKSQEELICMFCNKSNLDYSEYHVDHNDPPFRTIRDNFINIEKELPTTFKDCPKTYLAIFKDEDNEIKNKWIKYHNDNCTLQILCRECNIEKQ